MVSFHIKNIRLLITLLLIAGLFFAVYLSQKRQDIRQRATAPVYTFNSSSTINTPDQNNLTFWARKKSDGSYIQMDNTWWTGSKYAYIDTDDGDRGYFHNAPQASPNPTPATPASTSYTLPDQFSSSTQGERWEYYYLEAGSISTSALIPGTGRSSQWFGDGWTVASGGSWALINKREIGGGQPDKLRIIPGDNQKVYVYWKAPGPGQATINVRSTKTNSQGGGYKLGIAYTPDLANRVVANNIPLQDPFVVWGNQINEEKPLSGSHQMNGNDALVFYVDPDNGVVIQGGQTDTFAFGDVSENTITVQFTPTPPTTAPTTAPATNPTIDGMDANFKIAPGRLAPGVGYNAVARWTAPNTGNVTISGSFTRCCTDTPPELPNTDTRTVYIIRKADASPTDPDLWSDAIDNAKINAYKASGISPIPFTFQTNVQSGQAIDFMVNSGDDGSGWDSSTVEFTINYVEPSSTPVPTEIPTPTVTPVPPTSTPVPPTATPPPPTASPTPTTTPPPPTLTPTPTQPVPTATLAPTATPVPGGVTIAVTLNLQGIGQGGNSNPTHPQRPLTLTLIDANETVVKEETGTIAYNNQTGVFSGTVDLGQVAPTAYTVKVKTPRYLRKTAATIFTITTGAHTIQGTLTLVAGDISGDNQLDIADYNIFVSCFGAKANTLACGANKDLADLTDDGKVDLLDYRIFFENLLSRRGD